MYSTCEPIVNIFITSEIDLLVGIQQIFKVFKNYSSAILPFQLSFSVISPSLCDSLALFAP